MTDLNPISFASCKIQLYSKSTELGVATGFFVETNNKKYLVSNWHVFSGRDNISDQTIHSTKTHLPDEIKVTFAQVIAGPSIPNGVSVNPHTVCCGLRDVGLKAKWIQHPTMGRKADMAALDCQFIQNLGEPFSLNKLELNPNLIAAVGGDVFIVGFPRGLANRGFLPVWKRGSIASEPSLYFNDEALFLIDSATREGLSGSPVYLVSDGALPDANGNINMGNGLMYKFLGIYSGRVRDNDPLAAQIGRVYYGDLLDELLIGGVQGEYPD